MGDATPGEGEWERWGWALILTALVHAAVILGGLSAQRALPKQSLPPAEPELVFLTFMSPAAAAPRAALPAPTVPERAPRRARAHVQRSAVVLPSPALLPAKAPEPQEAVRDTLDEAPAAPEAVSDVAEAATGAEAVAGVVAGFVDSAMTTSAGVGMGTLGGEAVDLKQVTRPPVVLEQVQPRYPRQARSLGVEGLVLVRIIIGTDGRVEPEHTRVIRSVPALDAAAVSAVSQWRFSPAIGRHGRTVRVIIEVPVQFSLK